MSPCECHYILLPIAGALSADGMSVRNVGTATNDLLQTAHISNNCDISFVS